MTAFCFFCGGVTFLCEVVLLIDAAFEKGINEVLLPIGSGVVLVLDNGKEVLVINGVVSYGLVTCALGVTVICFFCGGGVGNFLLEGVLLVDVAFDKCVDEVLLSIGSIAVLV